MAIDLKAMVVTGQRIKPPKVVVYGVGGIGKTTFAAGAPSPIFLFTEEGQGKLDVPRIELRDEDPVLRSWEELMEAVYALYAQDHSYQTVVIDTLDFAEPLLWNFTARKGNVEHVESFGYGKGYGYAVDEARILFEGLEALRNDKDMAVILLAHHKVKKFDAPDAESYDRYELKLQEKFGGFVHDWADALLFAHYEKHTVTDDKKAFEKKGRKRAVGTGKRMLYTEERPSHWAKNRYGLPPVIDLDWQSFVNAMAAATALPDKKPTSKKKEGK